MGPCFWHKERSLSGAVASIPAEVDATTNAAAHAGTPTIVHTDLLGRGFYTIQTDGINLPIHSYEQLDITGNRMAVVDGRGLMPLTYLYNVVGAPIKQHSIDGGDTYSLLDVAGQPLYSWDANNKLFHFVYDNLRRPLEQWGDGLQLSRTKYGEGEPGDKAFNLRGQMVASYDGAGKNYVEEYDFKGIPKRSYMRLLADATMTNADWNAFSDADLVAGELFFNEVALDALGRPRSADTGRILGTGTPTTEHNITFNTYGKDGALKTVKVGTDNYVNDIRHNAKGQREAIWYGNGTKTTYAYDALSQRLQRLWTTRASDNAKYN